MKWNASTVASLRNRFLHVSADAKLIAPCRKMTCAELRIYFKRPSGFFASCLYLGKELLSFLYNQPREFILSFARLFGITKTPAIYPSPYSRFIMVFHALIKYVSSLQDSRLWPN